MTKDYQHLSIWNLDPTKDNKITHWPHVKEDPAFLAHRECVYLWSSVSSGAIFQCLHHAAALFVLLELEKLMLHFTALPAPKLM